MQSGLITITANNRLKRTLNLEYAKRQSKPHFPSPQIYTLSEWVQTNLEIACLKSEGMFDFLGIKVLSSFDQTFIFTKIIQKFEREYALLSHKEIAKQAIQTWELMQVYDVNIDELGGYFASLEVRCFRKWLAEYQSYCAQHHCIDQIGMLVLFLEYVQSLPVSQSLQIAGFNEINPLHQKIFSCFKIKELTNDTQCQQARVISFDTIDDEIKATALWSQKIIEKKPDAKIGIIVPDLENLHETVKTIFKSVLYPNQVNLDLPNYIPVHNFSLGKPLGEYDLIATAMGWFDFLHRREDSDFAELSILINNPYCSNSTDDGFSRAKFDWYLRENSKCQLQSTDLLLMLKRFASNESWAIQMQSVLEKSIQLKKSQKPLSFWLQYLSDLLHDLGFGNFYQTAINEQLLHGLKNAFNTAWQMNDVVGKISANEACSLVAQICQTQTFQFRTSDHAPIQIMGLLESNSQVFDFIWFLGANNSILPLSLSPNAILPLELQKARAMPRASMENELIYAKRTIRRLQQSTKKLIFSSAKVNADGAFNLPSGLLRDFQPYMPEFLLNSNQEVELSPTYLIDNKYETLIDDKGTPIHTPSQLRGALGFFKSQAICPLMAYAVHRLGASDLPEPLEPFNPMERGNLVHRILEKIMQTDKPKDALIDCTKVIVGKYVAQIGGKKKSEQLEVKRIINLLSDWFELVEDRRLPHRINSWEQKVTAEINGLQFNMRIDRIDALDDGLLLIDYKTRSAVSSGGWLDTRLSEPQLPLYAYVLSDQDNVQISSVAFGQISASKTKLIFVGSNRLCETDKTCLSADEWQVLKSEWAKKIKILAGEIKSGNASYIIGDDSNIQSAAVGFCRIDEEIA